MFVFSVDKEVRTVMCLKKSLTDVRREIKVMRIKKTNKQSVGKYKPLTNNNDS